MFKPKLSSSLEFFFYIAYFTSLNVQICPISEEGKRKNLKAQLSNLSEEGE